KAVRESLLANRDLCDLSLRLATIQTDCGIGLDYESAKVHNFFTEEAYTLYKRLNFKNLLHRFETEDSRKTDPADAAQVVKIASIEEADRVFQEAKEAKVCGYFSWERRTCRRSRMSFVLRFILRKRRPTAWFVAEN
ncbi:MAG: hypothetical protein HXK85_02320, partial [Lachnospiraceae bacterium]|nr:hypothetical protein [Lachnospiraceae bacterium]